VPIVFLTNMPAEREARWRDVLARALPEDVIVAGRDVDGSGLDPAAFDVAVAANPPAEALERFPALGFVQSLWAGVEQLVHNPALPTDAPLARLVDPNMARFMAEAVTAHVLGLHRDHGHYARAQAATRWAPRPAAYARERSIGFLGTGELARACMRQLAGLDFSLLGWSRSGRELDGVETFAGDDGLAAMLARADILVNLMPLTDATRGMIDAALLARLKPGAALVNVARGGHVVDVDLIAALDSGQLSEAVLDVFHEEPLPAEHPFWRHPRVHVFPHVAAPTDPESAARIAAANIRAFRTGGAIAGLVDRARGY
jgi:glyoxylate/hydroxypyruvate reductase A